MVAKETVASGKKMVDPFGDDDTLVGIQTGDSGAMSGPVNGVPEVVTPVVAILKACLKGQCKISKTHGSGDVAGVSSTIDCQ